MGESNIFGQDTNERSRSSSYDPTLQRYQFVKKKELNLHLCTTNICDMRNSTLISK